jgi:hypothetical protein
VQIAAVNALGDGGGAALPVDALEFATLSSPATSAPVPEPATVWILSTAAVFVAVRRGYRAQPPRP